MEEEEEEDDDDDDKSLLFHCDWRTNQQAVVQNK